MSTRVSKGCPLPPYIKEWGRGEGRPSMARPGGVLLPPGVGFPPFPSWTRREGRERGREGGRKGGHPIRIGHGGGMPSTSPPPPLSHYGPIRPIYFPGVPVTSRYSGICPNSPRTISMSKHRLPIYQSSCLDHFETPLHSVITSGTLNFLR